MLLLLPAATACLAALAALVLSLAVWDRNHCYVMPPTDYWQQASRIQPGMTELQAIGLIRGYTEIRRDDLRKTVILTMKPHRQPYLMIAVQQFIILQLDANGKVAQVTTGDG